MQIEEKTIDSQHSFLVEEALKLGSIEKAIILKEIRGMAAYKARTRKAPWVFYSSTALEEKFPYMASDSVRRWMRELESSGELVSCVRNKNKYDKTKSYSVPKILSDFESKFGSMDEQDEQSSGQEDQLIGQISQPIPSLSPSRKKINTAQSAFSSLPPSEERIVDIDDFGLQRSVKAKSKSPSASDSQMRLLKWAEDRRGFKFLSVPKQLSAFKKAKEAGIMPSELQERWKKMENEDFYKEHGFDWVAVVESFNRKR